MAIKRDCFRKYEFKTCNWHDEKKVLTYLVILDHHNLRQQGHLKSGFSNTAPATKLIGILEYRFRLVKAIREQCTNEVKD